MSEVNEVRSKMGVGTVFTVYLPRSSRTQPLKR